MEDSLITEEEEECIGLRSLATRVMGAWTVSVPETVSVVSHKPIYVPRFSDICPSFVFEVLALIDYQSSVFMLYMVL